MAKFKIKKSSKVDQIFANYPDAVRGKMQFLRELVIETAEETEGISELEETLKWGEPYEWIGKKEHRTSMQCIFSAQVA